MISGVATLRGLLNASGLFVLIALMTLGYQLAGHSLLRTLVLLLVTLTLSLLWGLLAFGSLRWSARRRERRGSPRAATQTGNGNRPRQPALLVLKGGGAKGLALLGAVEVLSEEYDFRAVAGTSAGAITASLLGTGMTPSELVRLFMDQPFSELLDAKPAWRALLDVTLRGFFYEGDAFLQWIRQKLDGSTARTGPEHVFIYATGVGRGLLRYSLHEQPRERWAEVVRGSMSIPLMFAQQRLTAPRDPSDHTVYDGGLLANFPVYEAREDLRRALPAGAPLPPTIGVYLGTVPERTLPAPRPGRWRLPLRAALSIARDLAGVWLDQREHEWLASAEGRANTCVIDTAPVATLDFYLTRTEKQYLVEQGRQKARELLAAQKELPLPAEPAELVTMRRRVRSERRWAGAAYLLSSALLIALGIMMLRIAL